MRYADVLDALGIDRDLILEFFIGFSRFEYALKLGGFARVDKRSRVDADWDCFAKKVQEALSACEDPKYLSARYLLVNRPPQRQLYRDDALRFVPYKRTNNDSDEAFAVKMVKVVRNNLFHGGKYRNGPVGEPGRDEKLVEACVTVLEACLDAHDGLRALFWEIA